MRTLLSLLSAGASVFFLWAGATILLAQSFSESPLVALAAALLIVYGVASAALLFMAWRTPQLRHRSWAVGLALLPLATWLGGSFDSGRLSGLEILSVLGVLAVLAVQVGAVRSVVSAAQLGVPADGPASRARG